MHLYDSYIKLQTDGIVQASLLLQPLAAFTLGEALEKFSANVISKLILMRDYLDGVAFLHRKNVMHRDIKPANLAITSLTNARGFLDFDMAMKSASSKDHRMGTPWFDAPEVAELKESVRAGYPLGLCVPYTHAADVWSMGLCAWSLDQGANLDWTDWTPNRQVPRVVDRALWGRLMGAINAAMAIAADITLLQCAQDMVQWRPQDRLTAREMLGRFPHDLGEKSSFFEYHPEKEANEKWQSGTMSLDGKHTKNLREKDQATGRDIVYASGYAEPSK